MQVHARRRDVPLAKYNSRSRYPSRRSQVSSFSRSPKIFHTGPLRLIAAAPSGDLHFETVVLDIDAGRQKKNAVRDFCL